MTGIRPFVTGKLNGLRQKLLLDTGASISVIQEDVAIRISKRPIDSESIQIRNASGGKYHVLWLDVCGR